MLRQHVKPARHNGSREQEAKTQIAAKSAEDLQLQFRPEELMQMRARNDLKGISFLDLGHNQLSNEFLFPVVQSLKKDQYVRALELAGNRFDLNVKILHRGEDLFTVDYGTEEKLNWDKWQQDQSNTQQYTYQTKSKLRTRQQEQEKTKRAEQEG